MKWTALLFDLDGTLVDSVPDLAAAVNTVLAEHGLAPLSEPEIAGMVGDGVAALVERALLARGGRGIALSPAVERYVALYKANATTLSRPYPGVADGLAELAGAGVGLAVCTNKPEAATRAVLEGLGLDRFFPVVLGGDSLASRKPDPAPLLAALDQLGAGAAESAMIGDHRNDVLAARAAGTSVIFARYGYGLATLRELAPDAMIGCFAELPQVLRTLAGDDQA
jgi:phosphoglycolate phosphatase